MNLNFQGPVWEIFRVFINFSLLVVTNIEKSLNNPYRGFDRETKRLLGRRALFHNTTRRFFEIKNVVQNRNEIKNVFLSNIIVFSELKHD